MADLTKQQLDEAKAIGEDVGRVFERIALLHVAQPMLGEFALRLVETMTANARRVLAEHEGN